jgi:hypothetical protein
MVFTTFAIFLHNPHTMYVSFGFCLCYASALRAQKNGSDSPHIKSHLEMREASRRPIVDIQVTHFLHLVSQDGVHIVFLCFAFFVYRTDEAV